MTLVMPTNHCFDDALDYLEWRCVQQPVLARLPAALIALVHGILLAPSGQHKDEPFAHAWVEERGEEVWQAGIIDGQRVFYSVPREQFATLMRLQECTRYSVQEAWVENERSGHYGPWVEKYTKLCGKGKRPMGATTGEYRP